MGENHKQKSIRIVVVDDHPIFRQGICQSLAGEPHFELVGEYEDGAKGLKAIRHLKPHIALLDVNLPTMNGLEILKVLQSDHYNTRVIVLTAHHDIEQTLHVVRSGAYAYSAKDIQPRAMVQMIYDVAKGYHVINERRMTADQVHFWIQTQIANLDGPYALDSEARYIPLSQREMEILKIVTQGMSNQEVALALNISQQTVKNHMTSILRKLNVKDRTQAAVTAIRRGWVRIQN